MRCLLRDWNHFLVMNFQNDTKPFIRQIFAIWSIHQVVHLVTIDNDQSTPPVARKITVNYTGNKWNISHLWMPNFEIIVTFIRMGTWQLDSPFSLGYNWYHYWLDITNRKDTIWFFEDWPKLQNEDNLEIPLGLQNLSKIIVFKKLAIGHCRAFS